MNQAKAAMFFQIVRQFDVVGGGKGVILQDVRASKETYYVADRNDIRDATVGLYVEIPCRSKGETVFVPDHLTLAWTGPMGDSSNSIRRLYLAHLYNGPLHVSRQVTFNADMERVQKSFDSKDVFADKKLRLFESLHDALHRDKLHDVLRADNYKFGRKNVFTRLHGDPEGVAYHTPRQLNYYPLANTVRVVFALDGANQEVDVPVGPEEMGKLDITPAKVNLTQIYRNEGWTSLRDAMRRDEKLDAFVRMYYANGYGKPADPEKCGHLFPKRESK